MASKGLDLLVGEILRKAADVLQNYDVTYSGAGVRGANLSDRPEAF